MRRSRAFATSLLLLATAVALAHAEDSTSLRFDPFDMPDPAALTHLQPDAAERVESIWTPELRATLVGDNAETSFANLGGIVLGVGESTEGYRLLEVREWEADFERGGEVMTLTLQSGENR